MGIWRIGIWSCYRHTRKSVLGFFIEQIEWISLSIASRWRAAFSSETPGKKEKGINGMKLLAHREVEGRDFTAPLLLFLK